MSRASAEQGAGRVCFADAGAEEEEDHEPPPSAHRGSPSTGALRRRAAPALASSMEGSGGPPDTPAVRADGRAPGTAAPADGGALLLGVSESQQRIEAALEGLTAGQAALAAALKGLRDQLQAVGERPISAQRSELSVGLPDPVPASTRVSAAPSDAGLQCSTTSLALLNSFATTRAHSASLTLASGQLVDWPASVRARREFLAEKSDSEFDGAGSSPLLSRWRSTRRSASVTGRARRSSTLGLVLGLRRLLRDPVSPLHSCAAALSLAVLLHDAAIVPLVLAWDLGLEGYVLGATVGSAVFWTLETVASALRGRDVGEEAPLEPSFAAARRYLRTWFLLDAAVLLADWLAAALALSASSGASDAEPRGRLARLLRLPGAVRAARLLGPAHRAAERFMSAYGRGVSSLVWVALFGGWCCHVLACAWFAVSRYADSDTGLRWVDQEVPGENLTVVRFLDRDVTLQYLDAFEWALKRLTMDGNGMVASNLSEQLFCIFAVCMGFVLGSLFVSTLSARLVEFEARHRERSRNKVLLRRFLRENAVPPEMMALVLQQAETRLKGPSWLHEEDVPVLGSLSAPLISKLRRAAYEPHLISHPLLRLLRGVDEVCFGQVANAAVGMLFLDPADELFAAGDLASAAFRLAGGSLAYSQDPGSSPVEYATTQAVEVGAWMAEASLWCNWIHVGTMSATRQSRIFTIQAGEFAGVVQKHWVVGRIAQAYCRAYHQCVVAASPPWTDWPDDLKVPFASFAELVFDMPIHISDAISKQALEADAGAHRLWRGGTQDFNLDSLGAALIVDAHGHPLRVTATVALQVGRLADGRMLWQLGRFEDGVGTADLAMPSCQRDRGELISAALDRLVASKLQPLVGKLEVRGVRHESAEKSSGMKALRAVFSATLQGELAAECCALRAVPRNSMNFHSRSNLQSTSSLHLLSSVMSHNSTDHEASSVPRMQDMAPTTSSAAHFHSLQVFCVPDGEMQVAYAWLLPEEVQELGTRRGKGVLATWVRCLVPPVEDNLSNVDLREEQEEAEKEDGEEAMVMSF